MGSVRLLESRAKGCLFGQAVGDALGTRYEFCGSSFVHEQVAIDKHQTGSLPILGGGPFRLVPGQVTDDTEMAMGLARSLESCGSYDKNEVALAYRKWFSSNPFDIGNTTRNALGSFRKAAKQNAYDRIAANSISQNFDSLSNGCLMRISPLAIAGCHWNPEKLQEIAKIDCKLTHPNLIAQDAVCAYVSAIRTAILTGNAVQAFEEAVNCCETKTVADLLEAAKLRATPIKIGDSHVKGDRKSMGYLGVAFQGAFYELLHSKTFEYALESTVLRGGDTDTNACIAGALLGASCGHDKIPSSWRKVVIEAKPERLLEYSVVDMKDVESLAMNLLQCKEP